MLLAKHNLTMERATGLISSLLNVASSWDVPFHQPQYLQYMYHGLTFVLVFSLTMQGVNLWCWLCHAFHLHFLKQHVQKFLILFFVCNALQWVEHSYKQTYLTFQYVIDYWGTNLYTGMPSDILSFNAVATRAFSSYKKQVEGKILNVHLLINRKYVPSK